MADTPTSAAAMTDELIAIAERLDRAYGDLPTDRFPGPPGAIPDRLREIARALLAQAAPVAAQEEVLRALEIGLDAAREVANRTHAELAGYKPYRHAAVDADVKAIEGVIAALRASSAAKKGTTT